MKQLLDISYMNISSPCLPDLFVGCKILHVSDLHSRTFGKGQEELIRTTKNLKPDYVFITGDLIDQHHKDIQAACQYLEGIVEIAPIYYVTGNHEWQCDEYREQLFAYMNRLGIHILQNEIANIKRGDDIIQIMGLDDPYLLPGEKTLTYQRESSRLFLERLVTLNHKKTKDFSILLSHRPEFIKFYEKAKIDLVFSGHAHGGQFRIPRIGGILAPHQGFFPKYAEGLIRSGNTQMIVSRGLGVSGFPVRINNRPELLLITLHKD